MAQISQEVFSLKTREPVHVDAAAAGGEGGGGGGGGKDAGAGGEGQVAPAGRKGCCKGGEAAAPQETRKRATYGSWASPISAHIVAAGSVPLSDLKAGVEGRVYWCEKRPAEQGRTVVMTCAQGGRGAPQCLTPGDGLNARTRVHEYGGGPYVPLPDGGIAFANFADQRLWRAAAAGDAAAEALTPTPCALRYANAVVDAPRERLVLVVEDHAKPAPPDVVNYVGAVPLAAGDGAAPQKLAAGHDFYAAPQVSPDGRRLAYIAWDHPNMPWDDTALEVVPLNEQGTPSGPPEVVVGGAGKGVSVMEPRFSPTGVLHWIDDRNGRWRIHRLRGGQQEAVWEKDLPDDAEFGGPAWVFGGNDVYGFCAGSEVIVTAFHGDHGGGDALAFIRPDGVGGAMVMRGGGIPRSITAVAPSPDSQEVYLLGGSPQEPPGLYVVQSAAGIPLPGGCRRIHCPTPADPALDGNVSAPRRVSFPTTDGHTAHALYYPPLSRDFVGDGGAPPLLVKCHGGPTAGASSLFRVDLQYWTSRGFAVADVDYRGSTGYGRAYRHLLYPKWGEYDVDDACAAAAWLAEQGLADRAKVCISGGSAGGFTVLACLAFRDVFRAGCAKYGIADIEALAAETHKFESRYLDQLMGAYPAEAERYRRLSPIHSIDTIACPILLQHGTEDKVVPPGQSEMMYAAAKKKGLPTALQMFDGEQHGFRKPENIVTALDSELYFYGRVFGFDTPGCAALPIDNLA